MDITLQGDSIKVRFAEPNQSQIFELDKFYRKIFSECIREGIMTEAEAKKRFKESGAWTDEDEQEIQILIQKLAFNSVKLTALDSLTDESTELMSNLQEDRSSMFELIGRKTELLSNTAEGMSNEQKVFKYISLCLVSDEGKSIFGSQEELEAFAEENKDDFSVMVQEAYALIYGIDNEKDITEDWAEVQFMTSISKETEPKKKKSPKKKTPKKKSSK